MMNHPCSALPKKPVGLRGAGLLLLSVGFAVWGPLAMACDTPEDPVSHCAAKGATIGEAVPCLKSTLAADEAALSRLVQAAQTQAKQVDARWPKVKAAPSLALSTQRWRQYRDAECQRRQAFRAGGNHPDIAHYSCLIEKTRQRIRDYQE